MISLLLPKPLHDCRGSDWFRDPVRYLTARRESNPSRDSHGAVSKAKTKLKPQLQRELDNPRVRRAHDLAEARPRCDTGNSEIRVIQRVEELRAELRRNALPNREALRQIEIEILIPRPADDTDSR